MEFAPRPELRPVLPKAGPRVARAMEKLAGPPPVTAPVAPEQLDPAPKPQKANSRAHVTVSITQPDPKTVLSKRIGGVTFETLISNLEQHREATDSAIAALRELEKSWPA
jgi:hypothetical protein